MRNKIIIGFIFIILLFGVIYFLNNHFTSTEVKIDTTYFKGKTEQIYKKGKDSITTKKSTFHTKANMSHSLKDSAYSYTKNDSLYNLSINVKPTADGELSMEYFLDLTSKELVRIDTVYQFRVDTLKIKETITRVIKPPFYNTFLFGAIVTGTIILLLINILK